MDTQSVLKFIGKALPWIGAAATGNVPALIGLAASEVSKVTGQAVDPSQEGITTAIANATPEQLLELKKADDELKLKAQQLGFENVQELRKLGVQEEQIEAESGADARKNFAQNPEVMRVAIAILAIEGMVIAAILFGCYKVIAGDVKLPDSGTTALIMTMITLILRDISGRAQQVSSFMFGSSFGSRKNQEAMASAVQGIGTPAATDAK